MLQTAKASQSTLIAALVCAAFQPLAYGAELILSEVRVSESNETATSAYQAKTATTATKINAPLKDVPQTVDVISEQLLRDRAAGSMQDALRTVPGVGLSTGDGQRDQVTIRGFTAISDQFIDGVRDDALYFRDLSNVERIEVIKGPASVLYGRGSSGGMINRITKKPGESLSEITVQAGSFNQRRMEGDVARVLNDGALSYRITGAVEKADSYRNQQFVDRQALAPSLLMKLSSDTEFLLQTEYLADRRVTDFGIPAYRGTPVDVDASRYYGAANAQDADYNQSEVKALSGKLTHRFDDTWSFQNSFRGYYYKLDRNNTLVSSVNETAKTASLNHTNMRREENGAFNQSELIQKTRIWNMDHQLLYGLEVGRQNKDQFVRARNGFATVRLFDPVLPSISRDMAGSTVTTNNTGIMTVASVYVQDMATLSATWKALVGLRHDTFTQQTRQRMAGQPNLERTDKALSPRAGLVWQPTDVQSYYASYSRSFQPSGEQFALAANNADMAPEETTNHEVGSKFDLLGGKMSVGTSLFHLVRTNIKVTNPANTAQLLPVGTQRTNGFELSAQGKLPYDLELSSGWAWLDGRMTDSIALDAGQQVKGKRPTLTPNHMANLWLTKNLGNGFGAGGGVNYVGSRFANPGNTVTLEAYTTVDLMGYYRMKGYEVQLNLNNVFNRKYIVAGHGSNANLNLPGAPRNATVTFRYAF